MAYNNVPQANQRISDTQPLIQSNFQQIQTAFSLNHVPIADASGNQGKHNFVTFPVQNPAPTITAPDIGLYSLAHARSSLNQLFYVNSASTVTNVPFTACKFANIGYAYFAGGILVKWGNATAAMAGGIGTITFNTDASIPPFSSAFIVYFTLSSNPSDHIYYYRSGTLTNLQFQIANAASDNTPFSVNWLAIGTGS